MKRNSDSFKVRINRTLPYFIKAYAAYEMKNSLPYWRTIKISGVSIENYPGGSFTKNTGKKEEHEIKKEFEKNPEKNKGEREYIDRKRDWEGG